MIEGRAEDESKESQFDKLGGELGRLRLTLNVAARTEMVFEKGILVTFSFFSVFRLGWIATLYDSSEREGKNRKCSILRGSDFGFTIQHTTAKLYF